MSTTTQPLKYLWTAVYPDTKFTQPEDDKSKNHDDKADWNPSAFADIEQDKLESFWLNDEVNHYGVNLKDGLFCVNGTWFTQEEQNLELAEPRRLIYFREVRQDFIDGEPQEPYVNRYFIGWQAKDKNGKNHKYTLGVK